MATTKAPEAVTSFKLAVSGDTTVILTWVNHPTSSAPYDYINVWRRVKDGEWVKLAKVSGSTKTYTDSGINPTVMYEYCITPHNSKGGTDTYTNLPAKAPSPVTGVKLSMDGTNRVVVSWSNTTYDDSWYDSITIERKIGASSWVKVATLDGKATSWLDTAISDDTLYSYRITATNVKGSSNTRSDLIGTRPKAPTIRKVQRTSVNISVQVSNNSSYAEEVTIQRSQDLQEWVTVYENQHGAASVFIYTETASPGKYWYRAKVANPYCSEESNWSNISDPVMAATVPSAPTILSPDIGSSINSSDSFTLTWQPNHPDDTPQEKAIVTYGFTPGGSTPPSTVKTIQVNGSATSCAIPSLVKTDNYLVVTVKTAGALTDSSGNPVYGAASQTWLYVLVQPEIRCLNLEVPESILDIPLFSYLSDVKPQFEITPAAFRGEKGTLTLRLRPARYVGTTEGRDSDWVQGEGYCEYGGDVFSEVTYDELWKSTTLARDLVDLGLFIPEYDPYGTDDRWDKSYLGTAEVRNLFFLEYEYTSSYGLSCSGQALFECYSAIAGSGRLTVDIEQTDDGFPLLSEIGRNRYTHEHAPYEGWQDGIYRVCDGKRKMLAESAFYNFQPSRTIADMDAPLNTDYYYEVYSKTSTGIRMRVSVPVRIESKKAFFYWNGKTVSLEYDPKMSRSTKLPNKKRVSYANRKLPVSYSSANVEQSITLSGTLKSREEYLLFEELMSEGGRCIFKGYEGEVLLVDVEASYDIKPTANTFCSVNLSMVVIDGGSL